MWAHHLLTCPSVGAVWADILYFWLPAPLLLAASLAVWRIDTTARYAVLAAGLMVLPGWLAMMYGLYGTTFGTPGWLRIGPEPLWYAKRYAVLPPWSYLPALLASAPAAGGWWQRRQDRLADDDSAA